MVDKVQAIIEQFLSDKYDALRFSYDLPDMIVENYSALSSENPELAKELDDIFPEICAGFERGMDEKPFKRQILDAFTELFKIEELDTVVILSSGKVGTVLDTAGAAYKVEWCDDSLPADADCKWTLYDCRAEDIRLLHKGAMRIDEDGIRKAF